MNKESILYGIIGLLAGVIIGTFSAAYAVNNNHQGMMRAMGLRTNITSQNMMDRDDTTNMMGQ